MSLYIDGAKALDGVRSPVIVTDLKHETNYSFVVGNDYDGHSNSVTVKTGVDLRVNDLVSHRETSHSVILDWNRDVKDKGDGVFTLFLNGKVVTDDVRENFSLVNNLKPDTEYLFEVSYKGNSNKVSVKAKTVTELISNKPVESISFFYEKINAAVNSETNLRLEAYPLGTNQGRCSYSLESFEGSEEPVIDSTRGTILMKEGTTKAVVRATNSSNKELTATVEVTAVSERVAVKEASFNDGSKKIDIDVEIGTDYPIRILYVPSNATGVSTSYTRDRESTGNFRSWYMNGTVSFSFNKIGLCTGFITVKDDNGNRVPYGLDYKFNVVEKGTLKE